MNDWKIATPSRTPDGEMTEMARASGRAIDAKAREHEGSDFRERSGMAM
jgi:hypothetical protein